MTRPVGAGLFLTPMRRGQHPRLYHHILAVRGSSRTTNGGRQTNEFVNPRRGPGGGKSAITALKIGFERADRCLRGETPRTTAAIQPSYGSSDHPQDVQPGMVARTVDDAVVSARHRSGVTPPSKLRRA
jgi:hypothetical protein